MKNMIVVISLAALLAGCSSAASRMAECRDQGYSRNTCYMAEQQRQAANHAAILAASEQQAYKNAEKAMAEGHHHRHHDSDD